MTRNFRQCLNAVTLAGLAGLLIGCSALDRVEQIGRAPDLRPIENPVQDESYEPVILPMPPKTQTAYNANSLWESGARQFFKDQRASKIGDLVTVNIEIKDSASLENTTERTRTTTENDDASALLGFEGSFDAILPEAVDPTNLVDIDTKSTHEGEGSVEREETIDLKVAAIVTQTLPNGNLVIRGRQEVRVNFEVRELFIAGVIRPEDITADNTIDSSKVAEARIIYGGRGQLTDVQQPRYGTQLLDIIYPF
jgi:flagellar L-ring protein precursor FlgH